VDVQVDRFGVQNGERGAVFGGAIKAPLRAPARVEAGGKGRELSRRGRGAHGEDGHTLAAQSPFVNLPAAGEHNIVEMWREVEGLNHLRGNTDGVQVSL
jgi:hypothetical protein